MQLIDLLSASKAVQGNRPDTDKLKSIYRQYGHSRDFIQLLLQVVKQPQMEVAAAWLLKHHLALGQSLSNQQTADLLELINDLHSWQARLQMLQCMQHLQIPASAKHNVEVFSRNNLSDDNKFVRAWAYDAFYRLGQQYPEYGPESQQVLQMGLADEPPSVTARIRKILV